MSLQLIDRVIERVTLIDDDPSVRAGYRLHVEDLNLSSDEIEGPIGNVDDFIENLKKGANGIICDYHLKSRLYSQVDGDVLVSKMYQSKLPVVLCTRWDDAAASIRSRRRYIPIILKPDDLSDKSLRDAFETCVNEFRGVFAEQRRPWKALVRIESARAIAGDGFRLSVIVPAWDSSCGVEVDVVKGENSLFEGLVDDVLAGGIGRAFAQVNLGAESADDLFFSDWEIR
ncbi:hypothetical protein [Burkholderia gladioli]|uniref:hypothetical protein n=1 Tax=Burkholderia gladioli TaxID=28095 RepID=UPI0016415A23|nr:hypothetical protein [Burkholderia gladioli]